jgi:hypothetical protein
MQANGISRGYSIIFSQISFALEGMIVKPSSLIGMGNLEDLFSFIYANSPITRFIE